MKGINEMLSLLLSKKLAGVLFIFLETEISQILVKMFCLFIPIQYYRIISPYVNFKNIKNISKTNSLIIIDYSKNRYIFNNSNKHFNKFKKLYI